MDAKKTMLHVAQASKLGIKFCIYIFQHVSATTAVYDGVRHGLPSQRGGETQEATDRADDVGQSDQPIQGGAKNGATLSHCKYSENSMTELRGNW